MSKAAEFVLTPIIKLCAQNGAMRNFVTKIVADPKKAAMALVLSQVAKDAFGCFFYVHQSLNNKEIPKDKRKFVAALDLSNGILMMVSQFTLGKLFVSNKFKNFVDAKIIDKVIKDTSQRPQYKKVSAIILPMVGSAIIAKRVLVPLIATPVASVFKNKIFGGNEEAPKAEVAKTAVPKVAAPKSSIPKTPISKSAISSVGNINKQVVSTKAYLTNGKINNHVYRSTGMSV